MKKWLILSLCVCLAMVGCSWEKDVIDVLGVVNTVATTLGAVIAVADPAIAGAVDTAVGIEQAADAALTKLLSDLQNNAATTTVGQIDADVAVLQQNTTALVNAAQIKNPAEQAQVTAVTSALEAMVAEIANSIPQTAASTTTVAAAMANGSLAKTGAKPPHSAGYWNAHMRKVLGEPSAFPAIDVVKKNEMKKYGHSIIP